ncbi:MAG: FtsB family cell division protein, partial [Bacteroidales bacterium]|jgi:cell division protein FtsB
MKAFFHHINRFKFLYTIVIFLVWMIFFDENKVSSQYDLKARYVNLVKQKKYYQKEIYENQKLIQELDSDTLLLEKIAREKYLMKRDNEVIYLIVDDSVSR